MVTHASVAARSLGVLLLTLTPVLSCSAACSQADLSGTWYVNAFFVGSADSLGYWTKCKLSINSAGAVSRSSSSCIYDIGVTRKVSGTMKVNSACQISATTLSLWDAFDARTGATKINFATMDRGKSVMVGVGDASTVEPWMFTGVKP